MDKEYIQPKVKVIAIRTRATILTGSFPEGYESSGPFQEGGTDEDYC